MRTIKFKGQMVDTAQAHGDGAVWVCSNCLLQVDGKCYIGNNSTTKSISPSSFVYIEFAEVVNVRQYTGLKDKNGVEIYEGDVLELDGWKPFFLGCVRRCQRRLLSGLWRRPPLRYALSV